LDFNYFHIPTRIIQGYESFTCLNKLSELSKKRVIMVTDSNLISLGATQNLRRFIDNIAYGLIFYEAPTYLGSGITSEAIDLVRESRAQTIIGFGNTQVLSIARGMAQLGFIDRGYPNISYIEIPSLPCIYPGLLETYYLADELETLKKPFKDTHSRAEWLLLDSSYTEFSKIKELLEASVQSLSYAVDALFSRNVNMLGESYALKAIELFFTAGNRLPNEPTNIKLKNELMLGSLLTSFAVQSSNLGINAGLAMAIENSFVCTETQGAGAVLMSSLEYSMVSNLDKFQKIFRILGLGEEKDPLENGLRVLEAFKHLLIQMEVSPLSIYNYTNNTLEIIAKQASRYEFMLDLSRPAGYYELTEIIKKAASLGFNMEHSVKEENPQEAVLNQ